MLSWAFLPQAGQRSPALVSQSVQVVASAMLLDQDTLSEVSFIQFILSVLTMGPSC